MKYKLLGGAMAALMLLCALAATALEAEEGPYRSTSTWRPGALTRAATATGRSCAPTCPW